MPNACGLRIGSRRFELFVLEGSSKNPKIVTSLAGEIPGSAEDLCALAAKALRDAIERHKIPIENVSVAMDAGVAAFRHLSLPITDDTTINTVIKFEVESQLPQFNIDEVIVDFYKQEVQGDSSSLIVTAVLKEDIQATIDICAKAGIEPLEIETEATALVNAAAGAGFCTVDTAQVLVHVGEVSTAVAIVDGGRVRDMRVIQVGALSHTENTATAVADDDAQEAGLGIPEDHAPRETDLEDDGSQEPEAPQSAAPAPTIERCDEVVTRLRRELSRTVSAARTANELEAVYFSGFELPGLVGEDILGIEALSFGGFEVEVQEGSLHSEYRSCAVAYGSALRQLGGGIMPASLRREELKFTGAFERLELPLAVMCLLLATLLGVWNIFLRHELSYINNDLSWMLKSTVNFMIGDPKAGKQGNLVYPPEILTNYIKGTASVEPGSNPEVYRSDSMRNRYEQLTHIRKLLNDEKKRLSKELGQDTEIAQPQSAFKGMTLVLDTLFDEGKDTFGRISLRKVDATYRTKGKEDRVVVNVAVVFYSDNDSTTEATKNYEAFYAKLRAQPWFIEDKRGASETVKGVETGIYLPSLSVTIDVSKAPQVRS
ncbi:MAG: pilus assembly protein PilM [bacterium]|nr:hypothetical protein [Planctomycetota bacterium]HIL52363.1 hypothetical protein [Planctomycetota bacterium]